MAGILCYLLRYNQLLHRILIWVFGIFKLFSSCVSDTLWYQNLFNFQICKVIQCQCYLLSFHFKDNDTNTKYVFLVNLLKLTQKLPPQTTNQIIICLKALSIPKLTKFCLCVLVQQSCIEASKIFNYQRFFDRRTIFAMS